MTVLYLYDDARARTFEPFALTRPIGELRAGAELIRSRWEQLFGVRATGAIAAPHLVAFEEDGAPPVFPAGSIPAGAIVANSRCVVALGEPARAGAGPADARSVGSWTCDGRVAAVRLRASIQIDALSNGARTLEQIADAGAGTQPLEGRWADAPWDLIRDLVPQLTEDISALVRRGGGAGGDANRGDHAGMAAGSAASVASSGGFIDPPAAIVLGDNGVFIEAGAVVEPQVCFDTHGGPIYISAGASVRAFTRLGGPLFVGRDSQVLGGRVAASAIGETCRAHGEMSNSVLLGFTNKVHDGFVGQSYLGRWVNFGAGTTTSNLKNTYGTVSLWTPDGVRDTGLQFLGTLAGDHAKTGIGLRLTTGTVLGAGANVYDRMPPKVVPPFSWGEGAPYGRYRLDKFLEVAARVMERRGVTLGDGCRRQLTAAYEAAWKDSGA